MDAVYQQQAAELHEVPQAFYCLQTYMVGHDGQEWCYGWSWDLSMLFTTLGEAETERAEFYTEHRTRIVKMKLVETEVVGVFEAESPEPIVKPGRLF